MKWPWRRESSTPVPTIPKVRGYCLGCGSKTGPELQLMLEFFTEALYAYDLCKQCGLASEWRVPLEHNTATLLEEFRRVNPFTGGQH
jgi:hypothetical protein